jgi:murein DD-endopeptidase MepM/ murein hydrolase activator NlpD
MTLDVRGCEFHPVVVLPAGYEVYDFTGGYDARRVLQNPYGVGRYDEKRRGMYTTALFAGARDVHVGVDLAGPVGEPVHAFFDGAVHRFGYNPADGDYGYTLVTAHVTTRQGILLLLLGSYTSLPPFLKKKCA